MFPLHQGDELCFRIEIPSNSHEQHKIPQDLILAHNALRTSASDVPKGMDKSRQRETVSTANEEIVKHNGTSKKKMLHRDVERQRRQEMATLYTSLRSLLPIEFIQGKRSISDHMTEAVNYIKHMQKKIKELGYKRDDLRKFSKSSSLTTQTAGDPNTSCSQSSSVTIRPCLGGLEITVVSGLREQDVPLSRVLQVLLEEGTSVVNCVTTKVNERLLHSLQAEVNDPTCFNLPELQRKLTSAVA